MTTAENRKRIENQQKQERDKAIKTELKITQLKGRLSALDGMIKHAQNEKSKITLELRKLGGSTPKSNLR